MLLGVDVVGLVEGRREESQLSLSKVRILTKPQPAASLRINRANHVRVGDLGKSVWTRTSMLSQLEHVSRLHLFSRATKPPRLRTGRC